MSAIEELRRLGEIGDLSRARALLAWDERTMMPPAETSGASAAWRAGLKSASLA